MKSVHSNGDRILKDKPETVLRQMPDHHNQYRYETLFKKMVNLKNTSWHLRYWATLHLENQKELQEIAKTETNPHIRREAVRKVVDDEILLSIAINDENEEIKRIAIRKIRNLKYLAKLRMVVDYDLQHDIRNQINKMMHSELVE